MHHTVKKINLNYKAINIVDRPGQTTSIRGLTAVCRKSSTPSVRQQKHINNKVINAINAGI